MAGLIGTLSLHGLVLHATLSGSKLHEHQPEELPSAGVSSAQANPADGLVLITLTNSPPADGDPLAQIASFKPKTEALQVALQSLGALPHFDMSTEDDLDSVPSQSPRDTGDSATRAMMLGRYTHQVSVRIERTWMRPRTPVNDGLSPVGQSKSVGVDGDDSFVCRVQIRQDGRGNVQEVLLLRCNGTEAWRRSLVVAINQASPMPAPPTPAVFVPNLTIIFEAHAYRVGDPPDAYEPDAPANALVTASPPAPVFRGRTSR